jgi:transposase-like protein
MCKNTRTPLSRTKCIECGYQSLAMLGLEPSVARSPHILKFVELVKGGMRYTDAARAVGISRSSAEVAFLRYIVMPEWYEHKRSEEEYVKDEPAADRVAG